MNHQPFETWIFTREKLSPDDAQALHNHLQECDQCYSLAAAWRQVQPLLVTAPVVSPVPGFVNRWQVHLEYERKLIQQRQSILVFTLGVGAALVFLLLLAGTVLLVYNSPVEWFLALSSRLAAMLVLAGAFQNIFDVLAGAIPITWWVGAGITLAFLCLLWVYSLQRLATVGRIST
jgi:anti-sigma factor RsiW